MENTLKIQNCNLVAVHCAPPRPQAHAPTKRGEMTRQPQPYTAFISSANLCLVDGFPEKTNPSRIIAARPLMLSLPSTTNTCLDASVSQTIKMATGTTLLHHGWSCPTHQQNVKQQLGHIEWQPDMHCTVVAPHARHGFSPRSRFLSSAPR